MPCNEKVEVQDLGEIAIDNLESVPDYFITERDIVDQSGNTVRTITRTPGAKVLPNGNLDNVFTLEANNPAIAIPEKQVRGIRVQNSGSANTMYFADTTHKPMAIALGKYADLILCQNCGVINMLNGHNYIVGAQYYQGANGEPTTNNASGMKLFIPVSEYKLLVNMN